MTAYKPQRTTNRRSTAGGNVVIGDGTATWRFTENTTPKAPEFDMDAIFDFMKFKTPTSFTADVGDPRLTMDVQKDSSFTMDASADMEIRTNDVGFNMSTTGIFRINSETNFQFDVSKMTMDLFPALSSDFDMSANVSNMSIMPDDVGFNQNVSELRITLTDWPVVQDAWTGASVACLSDNANHDEELLSMWELTGFEREMFVQFETDALDFGRTVAVTSATLKMRVLNSTLPLLSHTLNPLAITTGTEGWDETTVQCNNRPTQTGGAFVPNAVPVPNSPGDIVFVLNGTGRNYIRNAINAGRRSTITFNSGALNPMLLPRVFQSKDIPQITFNDAVDGLPGIREHYTLGEDTGNFTDRLGSGFTFTLHTGLTRLSTGAISTLAGDDGAVERPVGTAAGNVLLGSSTSQMAPSGSVDYYIGFWWYEEPNQTNQVFLSKDNNNLNANGWYFSSVGNVSPKQYTFTDGNGIGSQQVATQNTFEDGLWHFIVGGARGSGASRERFIYVNGTLEGTLLNGSGISNHGIVPRAFQRSTANNYNFGRIDQIFYGLGEITDAQVAELYGVGLNQGLENAPRLDLTLAIPL